LLKLLIGSVINQKSNVVKEFLISLKELKRENLTIDYLFIDYGLDGQTTNLLNQLTAKSRSMTVLKKSHNLAEEKNKLVSWAREREYDYLFMTNADLILDPKTLTHLISLNKDIVSEIYWTTIYGSRSKLPLRWLDEYVTDSQVEVESKDMINYVNKLASHGLFPSNVIGDSTLFSKKALQQNITFLEKTIVIPLINQEMQITQIGKHLGIEGFVDTCFSAFHVSSEADKNQISQYKAKRKEEEKVAICDSLLLKMVSILESYLSSRNKNEWEPFISLSLRKKLNSLNLRSKKSSVCYPRIILINDNLNEAVMEFLLVNDSTRFWYQAVISKNKTNWEIEKITLTHKESDHKKTATENKKKKIALIYHRYSGADTIALYKNIPTVMQNDYEIQLLKEEREEGKVDHYLQKINECDIVIGIDAHRIPAKRMGQIFINLWHGFPLKTMYFLNKAGSNKGAWNQYWSQYQYFTSYSPLYNKLFQKTMTINPNSLIITGQPRNDSLFCENSKEKLLSLLKINKVRKKIVFFAPTFRGIKVNAIEGNKNWDNLFGFKAFNLTKFQAFLDQYQIEMIVKLHPYEEERYSHIIKKIKGVHLLTEEMLESEKLHSYEILGAVDLLITDYSSIAYDYLLLDRPIIYTPIDLDAYEKNRGLLLSYNEFTPGPKVMTQEELQGELLLSLGDIKYYQNRRHQVRDQVHKYQDGNACKRVWEFIKSL